LFQRSADKRLELGGVSHDACAVGREKPANDVAEIPRVGTEAGRHAKRCGFEHVLAAATAEAAADEADMGGAPPRAELADRVDQQGAPPAIC
jgi:hypothetical protein